ncbi:MAG: GHMP family kinase ATP-binding protein [Pseudobdellovibrionaceae bacterium]
MIISKTPLRISFFGGGTDFPEFYEQHGGAVLGAAIDKNIYHAVTRFPSELFDYSIRLAYRKVECVKSLEDIEHAPFREILRRLEIVKDVEIGLTSDLPSFSGLGSSSAFTVGLINALNAYKGKHIGQASLAKAAIHMEREVLRESVGCQDQIFSAFGGFNLIEFKAHNEFVVNRVSLSRTRMEELNKSLLMFFTGITRRASTLERKKIDNLAVNEAALKRMLAHVEKAHDLLMSNQCLSEFGKLLDETWREKRSLDTGVSCLEIDQMYAKSMEAGALGGKLLGAGGGGFMLLFVPPERQDSVRKALKSYYEVLFNLNTPGSGIIYS